MEDGLVLVSLLVVLLLVLDCLNPCCNGRWSRTCIIVYLIMKKNNGLNPCCNGRWSRTRPYKTILIISKLKNFAKQILTFLNRKLTIP